LKGNSIDHSTDLILDNVTFADDAQVLSLSAASPRLIRALAERVEHIDVYDMSHAALAALTPDETIHLHHTVFSTAENAYDIAVLFVPKGRDLARAQIWSAHRALKPDGTLLIAGPTKGGAKSVISDAEVIFGNANTLAYRKSHRVGTARKTEQGLTTYPAMWGDDPTHVQQRDYDTPMGPLTVATMPGVFSWQSLDDGTRTLLDHVDFSTFSGQHVLDIGCGVGVMGLLAAKHAAHVTLTDDNLLAVRCTASSLTHHSITNAQAIAGDVYAPVHGQTFDLILSNPPFHKHFDVNTNVAGRIIANAPDHLNRGGRLIMVANAFLPYRKAMETVFTSVAEVVKTNRYVVLEGTV